jgi:SAM-dependent methyltransferase
MHMTTSHEVQRLRKVYRDYRESGYSQTHWSATNPGNRAIVCERREGLHQMLAAAGLLPLSCRRILDVGCGSGQELASFMQWGALPVSLYGVDLLPDHVEAAKQQYPELHVQCGNAERLEMPDASFDLVVLFTVFTSILDSEMARNVAREVTRVLAPGGAVVWYDFRYNNPFNAHVRGMSRAAIRELFPAFALHLRAVTLLPPIARRLGRMTRALYPMLSMLPLLRTHYLGFLVKPS